MSLRSVEAELASCTTYLDQLTEERSAEKYRFESEVSELQARLVENEKKCLELEEKMQQLENDSKRRIIMVA